MNKNLFVLTICLSSLCTNDTYAVDRIFAGTIITVDKDKPIAEAVAISGDRIVSVGSRESVFGLATASTKVVELGEQALLPGFIDAHGHMAMVGTWARLESEQVHGAVHPFM